MKETKCTTEQSPADERGMLIGVAIADVDEAVCGMIVDPRDFVRHHIAQLGRLAYPSLATEREAAGALRSRLPEIKELVGNCDIAGLRRVLGLVAEICQRLTYGKASPTFADDLREGGMQSGMNASWSTVEIEAVKYFLRPGERLGVFTPSTVKLGDRVIARGEVREALAKRGWQAARLAQLAEIERRRIAVDAENVERARRGEGAIVYTGQMGGMTRY